MIALIGSGNVAHWVAQRLENSTEFSIGQVYSRHLERAQALAARVGAQPIDDLSQLNPACEIFLFSLKDDAYPEVMAALPFPLPVALHTAGAVSQEIFAGKASEYGVLYPLQTFTQSVSMREVEVPLCVESNKLCLSKDRVLQLAAALSDWCYDVDEARRAVLHVAAVFACNFSNAMAHIAHDLLREHSLEMKMLLPLMRQTLDKLEVLSPAAAQTGPAVREDYSVMAMHIEKLPSEELKLLYRLISEYIINHKVEYR